MFTIKYQSFRPAAAQPAEGPTNFDRCEQIHGPFGFVSQEMDGGYPVVYAHNDDGSPGMTFGPNKGVDEPEPQNRTPPSHLYVMNASGATVATYRL